MRPCVVGRCILAGRSIKECVGLRIADSGCQELNTALFECKRGQLDMRKRIKGNMPKDNVTLDADNVSSATRSDAK